MNNGCSFLDGETPPEDVPVEIKLLKKPMGEVGYDYLTLTVPLYPPGMLEAFIVGDWDGDSGE